MKTPTAEFYKDVAGLMKKGNDMYNDSLKQAGAVEYYMKGYSQGHIDADSGYNRAYGLKRIKDLIEENGWK